MIILTLARSLVVDEIRQPLTVTSPIIKIVSHGPLNVIAPPTGQCVTGFSKYYGTEGLGPILAPRYHRGAVWLLQLCAECPPAAEGLHISW